MGYTKNSAANRDYILKKLPTNAETYFGTIGSSPEPLLFDRTFSAQLLCGGDLGVFCGVLNNHYKFELFASALTRVIDLYN